MQVQIHSIHFDADRKLLDFIEARLNKLATFHDQLISGEVFLRLERNSEHGNKVAEIKVHVPGADYFAKRRSDSFEGACDEVVEAIRGQMVKRKKGH